MKEESITNIRKILDKILELTFKKSKEGDETFYKINTLAHDCKKYLPSQLDN
jgi:hypothetical protein